MSANFVYYDEIKPMTQELWDRLLEGWDVQPLPNDSLYIGDDEADNPVYVVIDPEVSRFMGEIDGQEVWSR